MKDGLAVLGLCAAVAFAALCLTLRVMWEIVRG